MWFCALITMLTRIQFVVFRMILLFFPAMTVRAFVFIRTTISVTVNKGSASPVWTLILIIDIELSLSSKVLPVMCKNALISLMVVLIVRAPNSFKVEHIKVDILFKLIN